MTDQKILKDMLSAISEKEKATSPYDATAEVVRVDGSTAWVHFPGGVDETPAAMTVNAKPGDKVRVRVAGGQAWLTGSDSAPPTDDRTANTARAEAGAAQETADAALKDAARAAEAADTAEEAAVSAQTSATAASNAAGQAVTQAQTATTAANNALTQLSTVEDVVGTLNWIAEHGTMTLTSDTALDPRHVYFVLDANGDYVVNNTHYSIVSEPVLADISTYYELSVDESLNNYVATHVAVDGDGLWIIPEAGGYKILIATGSGTTYTQAGTYIIDSNGDILASFGERVKIGGDGGSRVIFSKDETLFYGSDGSVVGCIRQNAESTSRESEITERIGAGFIDPTDLETAPRFAKSLNSIPKTSGNIQVTFDLYDQVDQPSVDSDTVIVPAYSESSQQITLQCPSSFNVTYRVSFYPDDAFGVGPNTLRIEPTSLSGTSDEPELRIEIKATYTAVFTSSNYSFGGGLIASGNHSFAEGFACSAEGDYSHAEGERSHATARASHAEGRGEASGSYSHAEGSGEASGSYSHAEGTGVASGTCSHAGGSDTLASSDNQTVIGIWNVEDVNDIYAFIIGNGYENGSSGTIYRRNAYAVRWDGDVELWLNTSAAAGTTDGDLYAAITALSWESEVIV